MKSYIRISAFFLSTITCLTTFSQEILEHKKKIYTNADDKVYVNMDVPVYMSISLNADGSNGTVLKGEEPKYSYPMYFDAEGYNTFRSPSKVDPETGKVVYPKADVVFEVYADGTAPVTKVTFGGDSKVSMEDVVIINGNSISLEASDGLAGLDQILYSVDGSAYKKYTQAIKLPSEKTYEIKYYAVDNVGNVGSAQTVKVKPDLTTPSSKLTVNGDQFESSVSTRTTFTLNATDEISGLSKISWLIDEGKSYNYVQPIKLSTLEEGEHTLTYYATDKVKNIETKRSFKFFLDKSAPKVISEVVGNTFIANGREYFSGKTKLKLVALDNKSGVQEISYSVNGGEYVPYKAPFLLQQAGDLSIDVIAIDKVNNKQTIEEISNNNKNRSYVDLTGPKLKYSFQGPSFVIGDTTYLRSSSKIILSGTDSESGFKEIDFQLNKGSIETYDGPILIDREGFYKVTFNGYDNLRNSNTNTALVRIDNTGPEIFNRFSISSSKTKEVEGEQLTVYPSHVVLFLSATDRFAGLDKITYSINGGKELAYQGLIQNFKKGASYSIKVNVADKLGNKNDQEVKFFIE